MSRSDREGQIRGPEERDAGLARLYSSYGGLVYAKAAGILRNRALAEDATQETWLRVSRALERGVEPIDSQAWVLKIAGREALRLAGRRSRQENTRHLEDAEDNRPQAARDAAERSEFVQVALSRLTPEDRALLRLRFLEERSYKELRKLYGLSTSGVWDRVKGAIGRLRLAVREREAGVLENGALENGKREAGKREAPAPSGGVRSTNARNSREIGE